jgi:hypothetical protein
LKAKVDLAIGLLTVAGEIRPGDATHEAQRLALDVLLPDGPQFDDALQGLLVVAGLLVDRLAVLRNVERGQVLKDLAVLFNDRLGWSDDAAS